uniref:Phage protein n=1 Tax=Salmonella phage PMBT26 TaxID=3229745 RepID=A0AB39C1Q6_9CAUD
METLLLVLLGGSLLTILGLIIICSRLNVKNLELNSENEILNREIKQYNIAARKLLDKLENK